MPVHPANPIARRAPLIAVGTVAFCLSLAYGHEGHKPLPTKGATVDLDKGLITLSAAARSALGVATSEAAPGTLEETVLAYATLTTPWQNHAFVNARIGGRIAKLHARPGEHVAAGQLLAEIESPELQTLQLDLINARNDAQLAGKTFAQIDLLARDLVVPGKELNEAEIRKRESLNALAVAREKLLSLGLTEQSLTELLESDKPRPIATLAVYSSIAGTVMHADLAIGKVVEPNEHLFEVNDLSAVWVQIGVLERDLQRVQVKQDVELVLSAYPGRTFHTTIDAITPYLDPETHVGLVWARLQNGDEAVQCLPGMYGRAAIVVRKTEGGIAIPAAAIAGDSAEPFVLIEEANTSRVSEYRREYITPGIRDKGLVEVAGGAVYPGDRLVTTGLHELATYFVKGVLKLGPEARRNIGLKVEPVARHSLDTILELDGRVDLPPNQRGAVASQLPGTIDKILVDRGQQVTAGQPIAEISSLELQDLQLEFLKLDLQHELADATLRRLKRLGNDLVGVRKFWEAQSQVDALGNRRGSVERKLLSYGLSPEQIADILKQRKIVRSVPLRAPLDGTIVRFDKVIGQAIKTDETVFEVHNLRGTLVQAFVTERALAQVAVGQTARVRFVAAQGFVGSGKIVRASGAMESDRRSFAVWIELTDAPPLPLELNMLAQVSVVTASARTALAVPRAAIVGDGANAAVFVERADGVFDRRPVRVGAADDRFAEIRGGLEAGEMIVARGAAEVQTAFAAVR